MGHDVTVYNPSSHPFDGNIWKGVNIKKIPFRWRFEYLNLICYDYLCLKHALNQDFDVILELGYSPCSIFYYIKNNKKAKIVTNMDGFEWKRNKWSFLIKKFLLFTEMLAVKKSDALISDNLHIKNYLMTKYRKQSHYIPYGATLIKSPDEKELKDFCLEKFRYYLIIARLEPENNIEVVLDGYLLSRSKDPFIVVGPDVTRYSKLLKKKFRNSPNIRFLGGIYDSNKLNVLRWNSKIYFHGHSVGGTNPSLLEAMATNVYIVAHDNIFNRNVIGSNGSYFSTKEEISTYIKDYHAGMQNEQIIHNRKKIEKEFRWENVAQKYIKLFKKLI